MFTPRVRLYDKEISARWHTLAEAVHPQQDVTARRKVVRLPTEPATGIYFRLLLVGYFEGIVMVSDAEHSLSLGRRARSRVSHAMAANQYRCPVHGTTEEGEYVKSHVMASSIARPVQGGTLDWLDHRLKAGTHKALRLSGGRAPTYRTQLEVPLQSQPSCPRFARSR